MNQNNQWSGKKYEVVYVDNGNYKEGLYNEKKVSCMNCTLINYDDAFVGRFFFETENGGLEIIPMKSIVKMKELKEEATNNEI